MIGKLLQPEIAEIIERRDFTALRSMLSEWNSPDIAELIQDVDPQDQAVIFRLLPRDVESSVFEYLDVTTQESLIRALGKRETGLLLNDMSPDDRTTLLEELPGNVTKELISLLSPQERAVATRLLGYPEDSIGRLMTPDYIAVRANWTVTQVLDHIREHGKDSETILMVYVTDNRGKLVDDIRLRTILVAPISAAMSELGDGRFVALRALDDQETAVLEFKKHDREALPVIDSDGTLVGIVTVDDVLDVEEEETTEDIQKMGGTEALDEPYMEIAFGSMIRKRAGWLVLLFLGEMLTATAMSYFEDEISKAVVLALFIPLVISSGGNSGSQASTLVIRAMALGEVKLRDWWHVMRREVLSGLALGAILGSIGFLRISIWSAFSNAYGPHWLLVAFTIFFALIGIVLWGTLSGSMLPILLRKVGFDPAASSAPFVATLVDVTGLVIYFTVATIIMQPGSNPDEEALRKLYHTGHVSQDSVQVVDAKVAMVIDTTTSPNRVAPTAFARHYLDSVHFPLFTPQHRFVAYTNEHNKQLILDTRAPEAQGMIILMDRNRTPHVLDMTKPASEIGTYYTKRDK